MGSAIVARDAKVGLTAAVLFAGSVGGALWFKGLNGLDGSNPLRALSTLLDGPNLEPGGPTGPPPGNIPTPPPVVPADTNQDRRLAAADAPELPAVPTVPKADLPFDIPKVPDLVPPAPPAAPPKTEGGVELPQVDNPIKPKKPVVPTIPKLPTPDLTEAVNQAKSELQEMKSALPAAVGGLTEPAKSAAAPPPPLDTLPDLDALKAAAQKQVESVINPLQSAAEKVVRDLPAPAALPTPKEILPAPPAPSLPANPPRQPLELPTPSAVFSPSVDPIKEAPTKSIEPPTPTKPASISAPARPVAPPPEAQPLPMEVTKKSTPAPAAEEPAVPGRKVLAKATPLKAIAPPLEPTDGAAVVATARTTPTNSVEPEARPVIPAPEQFVRVEPGSTMNVYAPMGSPKAIDLTSTSANATAAFAARKFTSADIADVKIVSHAAESYIILDGDTYNRIAQLIYKDAEYAPALMEYNRATSRRDAFLPTGSSLRIPPREILDRQRYSAGKQAVSANDARPPRESVGAAPKSTAPVLSAVPPALTPPVPPAPAAPPSSLDPNKLTITTPELTANKTPVAPEKPIAQPTANLSPTFQVKQPTTLYGIAKQTLGDGSRWREIFQLNNDRLDNEYAVPVGVELRLPAGAKTPTP